jgi:hypothetical protein
MAETGGFRVTASSVGLPFASSGWSRRIQSTIPNCRSLAAHELGTSGIACRSAFTWPNIGAMRYGQNDSFR